MAGFNDFEMIYYRRILRILHEREANPHSLSYIDVSGYNCLVQGPSCLSDLKMASCSL